MSSLKSLAVGFVLGGALATIVFQQRDIANLDEQVAQQRLGAILTSRVLTHEDFVNGLSAKDALMWTQFSEEAADMPDATALAEYKVSPNSRTIPIGVRFRRGNDTFFTVVVGTRTLYGDPQLGQSVVAPVLAYYTTCRRCALTRLSGLNAPPEISIGMQDWHAPAQGVNYSLFREYLERDLRSHLRGEEQ